MNIQKTIEANRAKLVSIDKQNITFVCVCGSNNTKTLRAIKISGAFCQPCTQTNTSIKRIKNKIKINNDLLNRIDDNILDPCGF